MTLAYGLAGTTSYETLGERLAVAPAPAVAVAVVALLAGLLFKAGGVPAPLLLPEVAQAALRHGRGGQAAPGPVAIACVAAALSLLLGIASGLVLTFT